MTVIVYIQASTLCCASASAPNLQSLLGAVVASVLPVPLFSLPAPQSMISLRLPLRRRTTSRGRLGLVCRHAQWSLQFCCSLRAADATRTWNPRRGAPPTAPRQSCTREAWTPLFVLELHPGGTAAAAAAATSQLPVSSSAADARGTCCEWEDRGKTRCVKYREGTGEGHRGRA